MIFEAIKAELKKAVVALNVSADHDSLAANREAYGEIKAYSMIMESMGHKVDGQFKESERGLRHMFVFDIDGMSIDAKSNGDLKLM